MNVPLSLPATDIGEPPFPKRGYAQFVVLVLMLVYTVSFLDRQILSLLSESVRADLNISDTQLGTLQGLSFAVFYTGLGIPMGMLADRVHRRTLIIVGLILWSIATALCGMASSYSGLFLARMLVGVGEAALAPAAYSIISDYFPRQSRARALSIYTSGIFVGAGLAYILGGAILPLADRIALVLQEYGVQRTDWQVAFFGAALPGVVLPFLLLLVREPMRREKAGTSHSLTDGWRYVLSRWQLYATICIATGFMSATNYGVWAWMPALFQRVHGWSAAEFGYSFGLVLLIAGPLGMLVGGYLADRYGGRTSLKVALRLSGGALLLMLPAAVLAPLMSDATLTMTLLVVQTFIVAVPVTLGSVMLQLATPNECRGLVIAIYIMTNNIIGLTLGPGVAPFLSDSVFRDEGMIGSGIAIQTLIFLPLAGLPLLWLSRQEGLIILSVPAPELATA
ncbi:MAG: spinster family MFS transporter [Hyphomicrobiales bacterium]